MSTINPTPYFALLDDAPGGQARLLTHWRGQNSLSAEALDSLDAVLQQGWQQGHHAFLVLPYACTHPRYGLANPGADELTIHWFGQQNLLNQAQMCSWLSTQYPDSLAGIARVHNSTDHAQYLAAIDTIHEAIRRGDTYQINYTTRLHFDSYGHPAALYQRLRARQPVPYGVLAHLPQHTNSTWILSLSPELFLQINANGLIRTRPMKGTAPIMGDGQDQARALALQNDAKNRAENVMIVDLLRNDLGRIAATGQVSVPSAFDVSAYGQVWQMTSTVEAQAKAGTSLADIIRATFPCGSITGAPKRMSMHIIDRLETEPRHLYTGSLGYITPCHGGIGLMGCLNVAIRTLQLRPVTAEHYHGQMGIGSGIVIDSQAEAEYAECTWKSRFLTELSAPFTLFETMAVHQGHCPLFDTHLQRLQQAAADLHFDIHTTRLAQALTQAVAQVPHHGSYRLKVTLQPDGHIHSHYTALNALAATTTVLHNPHTPVSAGFLSRYKTSHRQHYDAAWQQAQAVGAFDTLLYNNHGILLEGGRSNVFVLLNGQWHTPCASLPILNGVMRQTILNNPEPYLGTTEVFQSHLSASDLIAAQTILLCNALRGTLVATLQPLHCP